MKIAHAFTLQHAQMKMHMMNGALLMPKKLKFHLYCGDCDINRCYFSQSDQILVFTCTHRECINKYFDLSPRKCDNDCWNGSDK